MRNICFGQNIQSFNNRQCNRPDKLTILMYLKPCSHVVKNFCLLLRKKELHSFKDIDEQQFGYLPRTSNDKMDISSTTEWYELNIPLQLENNIRYILMGLTNYAKKTEKKLYDDTGCFQQRCLLSLGITSVKLIYVIGYCH